MLIVYDYQIFEAQKFGGISRYFCALASQLTAFPDVAVRIVAPLYINQHLERLDKRVAVGLHVPQVRNTGRIVNLLNSRLFPLAARRFRPDVVHETYFAPNATYPGKTARVVTIFDMIHERWAGSFPVADKTASFRRSAIDRAERIICISENTRQDLLERFRIPEERVVVTHLGYDRLDPGGRTAKDLVGEAPYLLYVGVRNIYKNFLGLARAFANSQWLSANFRIVCFGGGTMGQEERGTLSGFGLSDSQVTHLSGGDETLAALYAGAAAFVYPSKYEGFGIPPLEAMSLGCPVIASNTSSIPEVAGDAAEYCDPEDPESIAGAIERVLQSEGRRRELIALGRVRCALFSWERCARETLRVYESALT